MKQHRIILMIALALFLFPFIVSGKEITSTGTDVIYVLDVSGSMKKG